MKATIILNPTAGHGRPAASQDSIAAALQKQGFSCEMLVTDGPGAATALARKAVSHGADLVIAAGGDGTVNEVSNGLVGTGVPMGILPIGTVNVMARELNIPLNPKKALQIIAEGHTRSIDLGSANGRFFTLMAGIGFDAEVVSTVLQPLKDIIGASAYVLKGLGKLATYDATDVALDMPDETCRTKAFLIIVANASTYTYGLKIAAHASMSDGLLDVCVFERPVDDKLGFARLVADVFVNRHLQRDEFTYFRTPSVNVRSNPEVMVQLDGEVVGSTPIEIRVVPGILPVIVPAGEPPE